MRLFSQLSWYFIREWRHYLGAVTLLIIIAVLQLLPPWVVGVVVDGVTHHSMSASGIMMWIGVMLLTAVVVYLLRYVWRVLLFGASYQLAVELREDFTVSSADSSPPFTCAIAPAISLRVPRTMWIAWFLLPGKACSRWWIRW